MGSPFEGDIRGRTGPQSRVLPLVSRLEYIDRRVCPLHKGYHSSPQRDPGPYRT